MKQRLTALILLCALLTGCAAAGKGEQPLTATVLAMDTVMNFTLYGGGMGEEQLRQAMLYAISLANDAIRREAARNTDYQHMGTTLVCALAKEDLVMVGNIGDSRAYHINGEGIRQISRDHSVVESMVEKGDITPQEARRHPNRNLITRALGPDTQAQADTFAVAWHPGDFILLCTDGLVNTVSDQEMLFEVLHDGDIESCLDHLMQISLRRGAPDNVTVVLLMNT